MTISHRASARALAEELLSAGPEPAMRPDPYWPKWTASWWKVQALRETGNLDLLGPKYMESYLSACEAHYVHLFPLIEADIPPGCDPYRNILCFCALGTLLSTCAEVGIDFRRPGWWMYEWLFEYLLPDGGYNCDEGAHTGSRKSSVVSSLPCFEAVLGACELTGTATDRERDLLDKGIDYLCGHRLYKSTAGKVLDPTWLIPVFPRFYNYDILRGMSFVRRAAEFLGRDFQALISSGGHLEEGFGILKDFFSPDAAAHPEKWRYGCEKTILPGLESDWRQWGTAGSFEFLDLVSSPSANMEYLGLEWIPIASMGIDEDGVAQGTNQGEV